METGLKIAGTLALWFALSYIIGEWITENNYLIETVCLLLIFGLIYQIWTTSPEDFEWLDMLIYGGDQFNRSTAQAASIFGISSLVITSILLRDGVEHYLGDLAVVQLLAFIGIISRMFVNVRVTGDPREIFDGERDTYLVYGVGLLAIVFSFWIRGVYPSSTTMHNAAVIFLSTILPSGFLYVILDGRDLPSWKDLVRDV